MRACLCLSVGMFLSLGACGTSVDGDSAPKEPLDAEVTAVKPKPPTLTLVKTLALPGHFTTSGDIYADADNIYVASVEGDIFALERSGEFPIRQVVHLDTIFLTGIAGDSQQIYAVAFDGQMRILSKPDLVLIRTVPVVNFNLGAVATMAGKVYVATGFAALRVEEEELFLSLLNEGATVIEFYNDGTPTGRVYGAEAEPFAITVYDRLTGDFHGSIPPDHYGNLFTDNDRLYQTVAGCCGPGINIYDKEDLTLLRFIDRPYTNVVAPIRRGNHTWLIGGSEASRIDLLDPDLTNSLISSLDLLALTGYTAIDDMEIRCLWADGRPDRLVFAGTSGGSSPDPARPTFFVFTAK